MPRKRANVPSYRYHISGQAVVTFCGQNFYLGPHDSPESWAKYHSLCAEYLAAGRTKAPARESHQADQPITVRCVTAEFREAIADRPSEESRFRSLLALLDDQYGDTPASDFGPRKLAHLRELFVASGNCRRYCNTQARQIVRVFRHAVSRELIGIDVVARLETLEPLRTGQSAARESERRCPVGIETVRATAKHLSPTLRAMVRLQVGTGMRPGEVFRLRPCDVDRTGETWFYRPAHHKTAHHGITKAVPIIGDAREALTPFLLRASDTFCFSPAESMAWMREQRRAARKTPHRYGNGPGTNRKASPQSQPGTHYSKEGYRQAIHRAAERAGVPKWTPYQLRHLTATAVRDALDIESAQHLLGHTKAGMTENYARVSERKAIEAAKAAPSIG
jgi:integrase